MCISLQQNQCVHFEKKGRWFVWPSCSFSLTWDGTRTHTSLSHTVSLINPLVTVWVPARVFRRSSCGVKSQHASTFWSLSPTAFISLVLLHYVSTSFYQSSSGALPGSLTEKHKRTCCLKPGRNGLVWGCFPLPVSWVPLHWVAQMLSTPPESCLFTCLTWSSGLNDDWRWSNVPTQVDAVV